jgi:DHA1 family bicyclomycin/chloramphenicol resistance-like MFS transporter
LLLWFDWRAIFWTLSGFGAICFVLVLTVVRESHAEERRVRHGLVGMLGMYGRVLRHRAAMGYLLSHATAYGGMFAFFAGSPFVYIELFHVAPEHYGYLFSCNVVALMAVSILNARYVTQLGAHRLFALGTILVALAGCALLGTALTGLGGLAGIVIPLFLFIGSLSLIGANSLALALDRFPQAAGSVSALSGGMTFAYGAVCTGAVGIFHDGSALAMAAVIAVTGLITLALQFTMTRQ